MTESDIIKAFRVSQTEEFKSIPEESEIEHIFSESFNRKMTKLLEKVEYNGTHCLSRTKKRIISAVLAMIIIIASIMSVGAVRDAAVCFVTDVMSGEINYEFDGDKTLYIEREYYLTLVPEGFEKIVSKSDTGNIYTEYENKTTGEQILFRQSVTDGTEISVENENGKNTIEVIDGKKIHFYESQSDDYFNVYWIDDGYSFCLIYYGEIEGEELTEMIMSVK